jgi:hypothetical protein
VVVRIIGLLIAVAMMAGAIARADAMTLGGTSSEVVSADADNDGPALDPGIVPAEVAVVWPEPHALVVGAVAPVISHGRAHGVRVFRPPR